MSKSNETIVRLDRFARRVGLDLRESAVNRREFRYTPTGRWIEYKPGGKGVVEVRAFCDRGGPLEAVTYRTEPQMEELFVRALEPIDTSYQDVPNP